MEFFLYEEVSCLVLSLKKLLDKYSREQRCYLG